MIKNSIIKKVGKMPGKTVAVFAGIHGNEKVGILTLEKIVKEIKIKSGTVYFVFANPPAILKNTRLINHNLNRLFSRDVKGKSYEHKRAEKLMDILDKCDALLDIHSYNSKTGDQFAITEKRGFKIVDKMDFPIVASGFSAMGHGTEGYMEKNKKVGICIECGTSNRYKKFLPLAEKSVHQFLQYYGCIDKTLPYSSTPKRFLKVKRMLIKKTPKFKFINKRIMDFDELPFDRPFATDGDIKYIANKGECFIFPRPNVKVGGETGIVGEFINIK
jgi:succinylglutamate desuccinylase